MAIFWLVVINCYFTITLQGKNINECLKNLCNSNQKNCVTEGGEEEGGEKIFWVSRTTKLLKNLDSFSVLAQKCNLSFSISCF